MYVMLKKKQGAPSHWFVPNDSYNLPLCGRQAIIVVSEQMVQQVDGDKDVTEPKPVDGSAPVDTETSRYQVPLVELIDNLHIDAKGTQWFQSRISLKGFRHCKNSGLSVCGSL